MSMEETTDVSHLQVQKALIALFLYCDFNEIIATRPASDQSYTSPVERCHAVVNLGIEGVGMMRTRMTIDRKNDEKM